MLILLCFQWKISVFKCFFLLAAAIAGFSLDGQGFTGQEDLGQGFF